MDQCTHGGSNFTRTTKTQTGHPPRRTAVSLNQLFITATKTAPQFLPRKETDDDVDSGSMSHSADAA